MAPAQDSQFGLPPHGAHWSASRTTAVELPFDTIDELRLMHVPVTYAAGNVVVHSHAHARLGWFASVESSVNEAHVAQVSRSLHCCTRGAGGTMPPCKPGHRNTSVTSSSGRPSNPPKIHNVSYPMAVAARAGTRRATCATRGDGMAALSCVNETTAGSFGWSQPSDTMLYTRRSRVWHSYLCSRHDENVRESMSVSVIESGNA